MPRHSIIWSTILGIVIGTVGVPVNVHSCDMADKEIVAETCGMCSSSHQHLDDDGDGSNCCDNRTELQHAEDAPVAKQGMELPGPIVVALISWVILPQQTIADDVAKSHHRFHSPPLPAHGQLSYLHNSVFLI